MSSPTPHSVGRKWPQVNDVPELFVTTQVAEDPPDGGYGWVQVGVVFIINWFTWGQTAVCPPLLHDDFENTWLTRPMKSYGVYLAHYLSTDAFENATALDFAFIGGLQFSISMLVSPLVTIVVRQFGTQIPMLIGIAIQTAGFIAASFSTQIQHVYISQGLILGIGLGFIFAPSVPILSQWFLKRRSLATGISSAGSGVGGIFFSFAGQAMIDNISLAWAFRITAVLAGVMNLAAVALIRNRNHIIHPPQLAFDTKLLFRYDIFLLISWGFISMLGYITLLYSLPAFAGSIGLSKSQAAAVSAFLNLGIAIGRPLVGLVSDRFGRIEVAGLFTLFCGLSCFAIWLPAKDYGVSILFAIVSGAVVGVFWMTVAPIAVEIVGLAQVPSLLSLMWLMIVSPTLRK